MNPLITVAELASALHEPALTILDVRFRLTGPPARADYDAGHVPRASFVDVDTELAAPPDEHGRHPLPPPAEFEAAMRRHGVRRDWPVVCYDFADGTNAARAWWMLRDAGHRDVRLLNGGFAAWVAAGQPVTTDVPDPDPGDFVVTPGRMPLLDAQQAAATAREGVLLDARTAQRYRGEQEPIDPVAGHIPGAVSAPTFDNVTDAGFLLSPERLRERFARLGVEAGIPVGTYCGSGINAAHQVLALEVAGLTAALYADSWSGWITDPARDVATGSDPG